MIILIIAIGAVAVIAGVVLWQRGFFASNHGRHADLDFDWADEGREKVRLARPDLDPDTLEPLPEEMPRTRRPADVSASMLPLNARSGVWQPQDLPGPVGRRTADVAGLQTSVTTRNPQGRGARPLPLIIQAQLGFPTVDEYIASLPDFDPRLVGLVGATA